jgi:hypothetical protein
VAAVTVLGAGAYSTASSAVSPVLVQDQYFSNVSLLIHADGTGSNFVDSSSSPKTISVSGVTQSTAQSKFGGSSAYFDGNSFMTVPYSTALDLSTGDWTVEAWWLPQGGTDPNIISITTLGNTYAQVRITAYSVSNFRLLCGQNGNWINTNTGGTWSNGNWYHLAAVRSGSQFYLFVNGTLAINYASSASLTSGNAATYIGVVDSSGVNKVNGYIDDIRVSKGIARYTSNFAVPTAAFPNS